MNYINKFVDVLVRKIGLWKTQIDSQLHNPKLIGEDNDLKKDWENIWRIWDSYTSPFRPSAGDIKNYEEILKTIKKKNKILIFGSTPELRDIIALKYPDSSLFAADFSLPMLREMLKFCRYTSEDREKWIKADWLSLDEFLKSDYFDVILGDLVLRNIEPEFQDDFLSKIKNLLIPGGFFIERTHFINEDLLKLSPDAIIKSAFDNCFGCSDIILEDLIVSHLFDRNTDFNAKKINKNAFFTDTNNYLQKSASNKREKLILSNILWKWGGKTIWTQRTRKDIDNLFRKHFVIEDLKLAFDYPDAEFYPTFVLKKK